MMTRIAAVSVKPGGDERRRGDAGIERMSGGLSERVGQRRRQIPGDRDRPAQAFPRRRFLVAAEPAGQLDVGSVVRREDGAQRGGPDTAPIRMRSPKPPMPHRPWPQAPSTMVSLEIVCEMPTPNSRTTMNDAITAATVRSWRNTRISRKPAATRIRPAISRVCGLNRLASRTTPDAGDHRHHCAGQRHQTSRQRRQPEHQLQVLGGEEQEPDQADDGQEVRQDRRAERCRSETGHVQHRRRTAVLPADEQHAGRRCRRAKAATANHVKPSWAAVLIAHTNGSMATERQRDADQVQWPRVRVTRLGHQPRPEHQQRQQDRHRDEKHRSPSGSAAAARRRRWGPGPSRR